MKMETMKKLMELLGEDEILATFGTTSDYFNRFAITEKGNTDIGGVLEDTLHRLLEAGMEDEVYYILEAQKEDEVDEETLQEYYDNDAIIPIDLGYVILGNLTTWHELEEDEAWSYCYDYTLAR